MPFFVIKKGLVLLEWKYFPTPKILDPTFPAFKTAYETYIDLHDALMGHHADELKNIITNYQPNGTPLDTAMHTLRKNLNGVINADKSSYSNGPIEGINRKIKELKRACYGFSNQANMFTRVYQLIA